MPDPIFDDLGPEIEPEDADTPEPEVDGVPVEDDQEEEL